MKQNKNRLVFISLGVLGLAIYFGTTLKKADKSISQSEYIDLKASNQSISSKQRIDKVITKTEKKKVSEKVKFNVKKSVRRKLKKRIKKHYSFLGAEKKIKFERLQKVFITKKGKKIKGYKGAITVKDEKTGIKSSFEALISKSGKILHSWNATRFEYPTEITHVKLKVE